MECDNGFLINYDIDNYLIKFLFITNIAKLRLVSQSINKLIVRTKIHQQMKLINMPDHETRILQKKIF